MGGPPVQASQLLEKTGKVVGEDKHMIVVRQYHPGIEPCAVASDQRPQGVGKAVHAFIAESDVRPVLVAGGGDQIDPASAVVVARAVHREPGKLPALRFQQPLFIAHFLQRYMVET
jgi:hypothetical protein